MGQVFENLQALADNSVAFITLDMGDKPDATGIVFIIGVVETLLGWQSTVTHICPLFLQLIGLQRNVRKTHAPGSALALCCEMLRAYQTGPDRIMEWRIFRQSFTTKTLD